MTSASEVTFSTSEKGSHEKGQDGDLMIKNGSEIMVETGEEKIHDAVFGAIGSDGPDYRSLGWIRACVVLIKTQLGLGVLAIPSIFNTLGVIPGVIVVVSIGSLTTWSDWVVGEFKLNHPEVYSIADVGFILAGRPGREIMGVIYWLFMIASAASGYLSLSIAFNAVSVHATCTVVYTFVAAVVAGMLASIQTLGKVSILGWVGLVSILASLFTLVIAVSIQDRPSAAPSTGPWSKDLHLVGSPTFVQAMSSISSVVFAYAGTPGFFNVAAEMRRPKDFTKSVLVCQAIVTAVYLIVGITVWHACGQYVASPALGSAGVLIKKVCYGIAIPGLFVSSLLFTHMPAKFVFVKILKGSRHLASNTPTHWIVWLSCVVGGATVSFAFGSAVPFFDSLVSLIGALLGTLMSMTTMGFMWMHDNKPSTTGIVTKKATGTSYRLLWAFNAMLIVIGMFIMIAGTYAAGVAIQQELDSGKAGSPFSCKDNSHSV